MDRSSSQLYVGMDDIGLDGWLSKVVGSLKAPSVPTTNVKRDCTETSLVRDYVTFHIFFDFDHIPSKASPIVYLGESLYKYFTICALPERGGGRCKGV